MTLRFHTLACCLIFIFSLLNIKSHFDTVKISQQDILTKLSIADSESRFAAGLKIKLSKADQYDLELIPGIPDKSCAEILKKKNEIILKSIRFRREEKYKAFEDIDGIGPQKALLLAEYLDLS